MPSWSQHEARELGTPRVVVSEVRTDLKGGECMARVNGNEMARYIALNNRGSVRVPIGQIKEDLNLARRYLRRHKGSERLEWTEREGRGQRPASKRWVHRS